MPGSKSHSHQQAAFRKWALQTILSVKGHPLQCLVDEKAGQWHKPQLYSPDKPSVDAGHMTSKWTGASAVFAIEDSDFNRLLNRGENKKLHGVIYNKTALLIGGVPVESRTAKMLVNTGMLPEGAYTKAQVVHGAEFKGNGRFEIKGAESPVPAARSNVMPPGGFRKLQAAALDEGFVTLVGEQTQSVMVWVVDEQVASQIQKELKTTLAPDIDAIRNRGEGVLAIARVLQQEQPNYLPYTKLEGVYLSGGANHEEALRRWHQPSIFKATPFGQTVSERYFWLGKKPMKK